MKKILLFMVPIFMLCLTGYGQRDLFPDQQDSFADPVLRGIDPEYHQCHEVYAFLDSIVSLYPEITLLDTSRMSHFLGYRIPVLKISDNPELEEDEPAIGYDGLLHSREPVSLETCLRLIEILLEGYATDSKIKNWIDNAEIFIIPMLNPDGWVYVCQDWDLNYMWYKNQHDNDTNGFFNPYIDGVNLNRNFDSNWEHGDPDPSSPRYRGAYPFSEMETEVKRKWASEQKYVLSINYHSAPSSYQYTESVGAIFSYLGELNPEYGVIRAIADSIASRTPKYGEPNEHYITANYDCDAGYSDCWMIQVNGSLEFGIETAPELYPAGPAAMEIADDNAHAGLYLLERVFSTGITGHVRDSETGEPLAAWVKIEEVYEPVIEPRISDSLYGRFYRMLNPGTYDIVVSREGYETAYFDDLEVTGDTLVYLDVQLNPISSWSEPAAAAREGKGLHAFPNPSAGMITLAYHTAEGARVKIVLCDQTGCQLMVIEDTFQAAGSHQLVWDATPLPAGIYYLVLKTNTESKTTKVIILE